MYANQTYMKFRRLETCHLERELLQHCENFELKERVTWLPDLRAATVILKANSCYGEPVAQMIGRVLTPNHGVANSVLG